MDHMAMVIRDVNADVLGVVEARTGRQDSTFSYWSGGWPFHLGAKRTSVGPGFWDPIPLTSGWRRASI
jgi:hypothetical protein